MTLDGRMLMSNLQNKAMPFNRAKATGVSHSTVSA